MQFIDTHIHLQDVMSNNATDILSTALQKGCRKMICVSAQQRDWADASTYGEQFPSVIPAFGIHPWYVQDVSPDWQEQLHTLLLKHPQALLGECGLDGLKPNLARQKEIFLQHLKIAQEYHRPLIIHAVKAVPLLEEFWSFLPEKFVIHGFNGKSEFLKQILRHNGYIGIGSALLKTPKATDILKQIPIDRLLFETDAPFQADYPWDIIPLISAIAPLYKISAEQLAQQVYQNSEEFIK